MLTDAKRAERQSNYQALQDILPEALAEHDGQFAVMRYTEIVGCFATASEALRHGRARYSDDMFSVQTVTAVTADLGWLSRVPGHLSF
jgi:hypothetical protein